MMKKIFTLIAFLAVSLCTMAQSQYFYEWKDGKYVQRSVSEVDSITFSLPESAEKEYRYVDLGLPSGTLWADRNVGADSPEDCGDYFAWGETAPKSYYDWSTYKWCKGSNDTMTKYCTNSIYGTVDNKTVLDLEDDAAYANMSPEWRMPTKDELTELRDYCTWVWTNQNGTNGWKVTGPNGNSIFLPASGERRDSGLYYVGSGGYYWSSSRGGSNPGGAWGLNFASGGHGMGSHNRCNGHTVRAVVSTVTVEPAPEVKKVDLGLPSGTLWADRNVGADSPEAHGDYFAWGETAPKSYYDLSTYRWCRGDDDTMTKYCTNSYYGTVDNKTVLDLEDDAAYVNMGPEWRMPTRTELNELNNECTWTWTTQNGTRGYKVTGPNGNFIFFPAAGSRYDSNLNRVGSDGYYWSSSLRENYPYEACILRFASVNYGTYYSDRGLGLTVRAVVR